MDLLVGTRKGDGSSAATRIAHKWRCRSRCSSATSCSTWCSIRATGGRCCSARAPATSGRRCSARPISGAWAEASGRRRSRRRPPRTHAASRVLAHARPRRRARRLVRGRVAAGPVPHRDGGDTWEPVAAGTTIRSGSTGRSGPSEGTPDGSMLHSINVDPRDPAHLYIGLSGGGVFESIDGGARLEAAERGLPRDVPARARARVRPRPALRAPAPAAPDRLYQQNHCGIYRIERADGRWTRIGDNMPSESATSGSRSSCIRATRTPRGCSRWTAPTCGRARAPTAGPPPTSHTTPGDTGRGATAGCPTRAWYTVKRQAMTADDADPVGVYFGTTSGELWASIDEGAQWTRIAEHCRRSTRSSPRSRSTAAALTP